MGLYEILWALATICLAPIALFASNERLLDRLALRLPNTPLEGKNVWIHALSVGEVLSAIPLVNRLHEDYPETGVVFTVTTSKGMAIARRELGDKVRALLTMPVDACWPVRAVARYIRPEVFVLVETDLWPCLLHHLGKKGVRCLLINGRVSPRTCRSYAKFPLFPRMMYGTFEKCMVQSGLDRQRLLVLGVESEKLETAGNIKFDREWSALTNSEQRNWQSLLGLGPEDRIWVSGSTHRGEEGMILRAFQTLQRDMPDLRLIIAPRRIEEAALVLEAAESMGFRCMERTALPAEHIRWEVLVLDTIGELGRIYGLGEVSFVGGSLVPFGGHNLLEPANFGCPVLFGPHTHNFVEMSEALAAAGGGKRVRDEKELCQELRILLTNEGFRKETGRRGKAFVEENRGALDRVVSRIVAGR